jgi:hypothetical protein
VVQVGPAFVADGEPAEAVEPGRRALHDPALAANPLAAIDALSGDPVPDPALAAGSPALPVVVTLVGVRRGRAPALPAGVRMGGTASGSASKRIWA